MTPLREVTLTQLNTVAEVWSEGLFHDSATIISPTMYN